MRNVELWKTIDLFSFSVHHAANQRLWFFIIGSRNEANAFSPMLKSYIGFFSGIFVIPWLIIYLPCRVLFEYNNYFVFNIYLFIIIIAKIWS